MPILIELTKTDDGNTSQVKHLEVGMAIKSVVDGRKERADDNDDNARIVQGMATSGYLTRVYECTTRIHEDGMTVGEHIPPRNDMTKYER